MESRNTSLTFFAAQDFPGEGCASGSLSAEAAHRTMAEDDQHTKGRGDDMGFVSAGSHSDPINNVQMNGTGGEASVGSTSSLEAAETEEILNSQSETPTVPEANGDESPKDSPKPHFHAVEHAKDRTVDAEIHVPNDGIRTNSDSGSHTITPIRLVNGYEEAGATGIASDTQDDIWSPATKLKRRLEDTKDLIVCPGVYDGFSARIALSVGFDTMYMVGKCFSGTSQSLKDNSS